MRKTLIFFLATLMITACGDGVPNGVLSKKKMEKVLWEVMQGSEFANGYIYYRYPQLNRAAINNTLLDEIFKTNKITKKEFNKSLEYYQNHPDLLMVMMDSIQAKKSRERIEENAKQAKADSIQRKKDSLKIKRDTLIKKDSIRKPMPAPMTPPHKDRSARPLRTLRPV